MLLTVEGSEGGGSIVAGEHAAKIENFATPVLVDHPRLGRVRMNAASYDAETRAPIIEGPTTPEPHVEPATPLKDPTRDNQGWMIHEPRARCIAHEAPRPQGQKRNVLTPQDVRNRPPATP